ncbi:SDR family oxidoreductase [Amycolatopsis jejuensis]|uniref:SDR family oxidoreductase n=1 Tax=Amycolatopsis jejuensis TaxID=330084 RepID=UPI0005250A01|nr:SDR family oxidoreductase [Amycolatopsis jejuensis]
MDFGLRGRTAVVCASTSGLGEATARALAAEGAHLVVCGRRGDRAAAIAAELPSAVGVGIDLTASGGPEQLLEAARVFGPVDILVLNGPGPSPGTAADLDLVGVSASISALVRPHVELTSLVLGGMRSRGWGRILAIGSISVATPLPGLVQSNLGRAALAAYLKTLATEVAADGVTVNMMLPGWIRTARTAALDAEVAKQSGRSAQEIERESRASIPAGRYGDPAEFGAAAAFLCSAQAAYVTGTTLRCDGGLVPSL